MKLENLALFVPERTIHFKADSSDNYTNGKKCIIGVLLEPNRRTGPLAVVLVAPGAHLFDIKSSL